jgi:uncharacterized protein (DUF302 family)
MFSPTLYLVAGVLLGALGFAAIVRWMLRTKMIVAHQSQKNFDQTCAAIERVVPQNPGWGFPLPSWDMLETLRAKDQIPTSVERLQMFFVCNPGLAKQVLSADPAMSGMMPCSWAVYERTDGTVWVSKMNIPLMARLFSGAIGGTMQQVGAADEAFLQEVLAPSIDD